MPLPNPQYVQMPNLQNYFVDKQTGLPLAAGYLLFFEDEARTVPKNVYIQTQSPGPTYSYVSIGSQVTLSAVGTTQYLGTDSLIYLYPYDANGNPELYYIEVFSSTNILQFTRSAIPSGISASPSASGFTQSQNIISNPQFAQVLFDSVNGATINVTGTVTTQIAPDWSVITTGTGSFTVNQIAITDALAPGEPAYALDITSASINTLTLSQRITKSPRILENNFASGTFIAEAIAPTASAIITMNYVPSVGSTVPIVVGTASAGSFTLIAGTTAAVIPQTNTNPPGSTGYVDIQFVIPVGDHIQISCIQIVSVLNASTVATYVQESVPRQIDHLFHYYYNSIIQQPKNSILVGWDFGLNPWQFANRNFANVAANQYVTDQTVIVQQNYVAAATGNNIQTGSSQSSGAALLIKAVNTSSQFAVIQYLDSTSLYPYWGQTMSALLNAFITTVNSTACKVKMRLIWRASIPSTIGQTEPIASWTAGQDPVFSAGWTAIAPILDPSYNLGTSSSFFPYNQFQLPAITNANMTLALVLYTMGPLATATSADIVTINSCSLVRNDFAIDATPQTADQVLRECQYYYEISFPAGYYIGSTNIPGGVCFSQLGGINVGGNDGFFATGFCVPYLNAKRTLSPTVLLYNPTSGNSGKLLGSTYAAGSSAAGPTDLANASYWTGAASEKAVNFVPASNTLLVTAATAGSTNVTGFIRFHYSVDARLGLVT